MSFLFQSKPLSKRRKEKKHWSKRRAVVGLMPKEPLVEWQAPSVAVFECNQVVRPISKHSDQGIVLKALPCHATKKVTTAEDKTHETLESSSLTEQVSLRQLSAKVPHQTFKKFFLKLKKNTTEWGNYDTVHYYITNR